MTQSTWPPVAQQLAEATVVPGSALEQLIHDNQHFQMLRAEEAQDTLGVPPWLRVYWRKQHPEGVYSAADPTGGYPRVLKNIHTWMLAHQDLKPEPPANPAAVAAPPPPTMPAPPVAAALPAAPAAPQARVAVGANLRTSGAQTTPGARPISGSTSTVRIR